MSAQLLHQYRRSQSISAGLAEQIEGFALHQLKCERTVIQDLLGTAGSPQHRYLKCTEWVSIHDEGVVQCWSRGLKGYPDDLEHTFDVSPLILKGQDDVFKEVFSQSLYVSAQQHKVAAQQRLDERRHQLQHELNNLQSL